MFSYRLRSLTSASLCLRSSSLARGDGNLVVNYRCGTIRPAVMSANPHAAIAATSIGCLALYWEIWLYFWRTNTQGYFYFDAQDIVKNEEGRGRHLPMSATTGRFEPLLVQYISVAKLLITLAAASITFGGNPNKDLLIFIAKLILAFSIVCGVLFCALVLYLYDEYTQNVEVLTRFRYCTIEALGFTTLFSFFLGYVAWALNLGST
jgi:hypothetical protein